MEPIRARISKIWDSMPRMKAGAIAAGAFTRKSRVKNDFSVGVWRVGMIEKTVNQLLQKHIEDAREEQGPLPKRSGAERRTATRLDANTTELTVRTSESVNAIDISVAGLAFFSNLPVQIGQQLQITLGTMFTVDAEVVNCKLEEQDPNFLDLLYKVQCKFPEEEQGKYLLVAIKELEKRQDKSASSKK